MVTVLSENKTKDITGGTGTNGGLWIPKPEVESLTGWTLKPEGFCKEELCVAIPPDREGEFVRGDAVNVAAFWEKMGMPALHDEAGATGIPATFGRIEGRSRQLLPLNSFIYLAT